MTKFIITAESGSDLPKELVERYGVRIIPMHVTMGDETRPDGTFPVEEVFDFYEKTGTLPKTAGSTPDDNAKCFRQIFEEYPDAHIIHIAYSAVTTVSFNAAKIAAEDFENIHLVDSKNVAIGQTAIIKATAEYIENHPDASPEDIIAFVENIRERTRFIFLPNTLLYLKAGGRVSNLAFHGAALLNIHPTIVIEDGYLVSGKKYRGNFDRCIKKMIADFFNIYNIDPETVMVCGSPGVSDENKELVYSLLSQHNANTDQWFDTGAVISSHGGPGAIGLLGIERE
ncbi:DegV family protein [Ruoffia sp. FAM 20858]|uniref:DegV family protein n=1 Tax=Ruoffia sp. FAM 20858 TaxID=3259516 RepID=UPI00388A2EBD